MAKNGRYDEALSSLDQALVLGADPYDCYLRQSLVYQSLGRPREAISAAEKAVAVKPRMIAAREAVVALLLELREFRRAVEASQELLRIAPRHMAARDAMGAAFMGMGDVEAAMRVTNEMMRLDPGEPLHRLKRAMLLEHQGETRMAIADLQRVLDTTDDPTLAQTVRSHLDTLDLSELQKIVLLATEDPVFRAKLMREPERAITERGFALTEWGLRRLEEMATEELANHPSETSPRMYH